jgi:hypothetical protein
MGIKSVTGNYGTVQTFGAGTGNWEGYSIDGRYVFMSADDNSCGIYNDVDNDWLWYYHRTNKYHRWSVDGIHRMYLYDEEFRLDKCGGNEDDWFRAYTTDGGGLLGFRWNGSGTNYNCQVIMKDNGSPYSEQTVGKFENDSSHNNNINFTGQHKCMSINNLDPPNVYGLIVYSTGNYMNVNNTIVAQMNECLPICDLCISDNDIRVFGVISDDIDTGGDDNTYGLGAFKTVWKKSNENEERLFINSVGEGAVWICNKNGDMLNGDYITSCPVQGYGAKQSDDLLHNYTVGKITSDCDFSLTKIIKQKIKVEIITTSMEAQDFRIVEKIIEKKEIVYDENIQGYIETIVSKTINKREKLFEIVPLYDTQGNQLTDDKGILRTYEKPIMKTYTKTTKELIYDSNGNVQYEDDLDEDGNQQIIYKYDTRFLNSDGTLISTEEEYKNKKDLNEDVYIACFVGCTYHCG